MILISSTSRVICQRAMVALDRSTKQPYKPNSNFGRASSTPAVIVLIVVSQTMSL